MHVPPPCNHIDNASISSSVGSSSPSSPPHNGATGREVGREFSSITTRDSVERSDSAGLGWAFGTLGGGVEVSDFAKRGWAFGMSDGDVGEDVGVDFVETLRRFAGCSLVVPVLAVPEALEAGLGSGVRTPDGIDPQLLGHIVLFEECALDGLMPPDPHLANLS